jgi:hypothetical protein
MPLLDAGWLYKWLPVGTPVIVSDETQDAIIVRGRVATPILITRKHPLGVDEAIGCVIGRKCNTEKTALT